MIAGERPKIKLIFPCRYEAGNNYLDSVRISLPYGMGVLTSYLKSQGIYVEQDDLAVRFNHNTALWHHNDGFTLDRKRLEEDIDVFFRTHKLSDRLDRLSERILKASSIKGFDIIGFSIFSYLQFPLALLLSHKIKESCDTPIVFGGPFVTMYGRLYPDAFRFLDYMIAGEGGAPLTQLARCVIQKTSLDHIPGLIHKVNGKLSMVPPLERSIEEMPLPDFEGLPIELYRAKNVQRALSLPYQITRGCDGACTFCNVKNMSPHLEFKSYHKVITELKWLKEKYRSNIFYFCESGAINASDEYLKGLCDELIRHKVNIRWTAYTKIARLDKETLGKMRSSGCCVLGFGVESGSDRILGMMNKGITSAQSETVLRDAARLGIRNSIFLVAGYPHETEEDVVRTVDFIRRNRRYLWFASINSLRIFHGTELWSHPERHGITELAPAGLFNPVFEFDEIGGLRWPEKLRQQDRAQRRIFKAVKRDLMPRFMIDTLLKQASYFIKKIIHIKTHDKFRCSGARKFFVDFTGSRFLQTSVTGTHPNRLNWRAEIMLTRNSEAIKGKRVLDLASHDGRFTYACLKLGAEHVTGVEARSHLIDHARQNLYSLGFSDQRFTFIQKDVFDYLASAKRGEFDTVLCLGFFYHTVKQAELVQEIKRIGPRYFIFDTVVKKELWRHEKVPALFFRTEDSQLEGTTISAHQVVAWPTETFIDFLFKANGLSYTKLGWKKGEIKDWSGIKDFKAGRRQFYLIQLF